MRPALLGSGFVRSRFSTPDNQQHHDPDATPTRSRPPRPSLRSPLQPRDSNAKMRVPPKGPLVAKTSNGNMPPYDKQQSNSSRPLMPTLSAAAKTSNRPPLTPRVAGTAPQTVTSPLSRRGARPETPGGASREDIPPTPVSSFLNNNNITPRSGSRQSRVHSNNTTPTGTPNGTPVLASSGDAFRIAQDAPQYGPGLGITGMDKDIPKRPTVSFSPSVSDIGNSRSPQSAVSDSKFFFASEAKTAQPARPPIQTKNSSTFVYANGETIPPPTQSAGPSVAGSMVGEERSQPKFFHANGTPDLTSPNAYFPPSRPGSALSTSSRMTSTRIGNQSPGASFSPPVQSRPASPSKLNQFIASSVRSPASMPPIENTRPTPVGRGNSAPANATTMARRVSVDTSSLVMGHVRSSSSGSGTVKSPSIRNVSGGSSIDAPLASPSNLSTMKTNSVPEETTDETNDGLIPPQSPIKSSHTLEQLNELAANARRERKVLDLEITNSSLAAINRTLEREMRKQTAELRRYRRLSRSGRLSIATSASMRTSLGTIGDESLAGLSDMSEEEEESEDDEDLSDEETSDEGSLSPDAMAESDLRHRKRDEKRLQLDLTKHQQLLIDSQKMNQSLKRCLGLTEELIGEGKKALEYQVRVSDIELGGRVLAPDEVEGEEDHEGMSAIGGQLLRVTRQAAVWGGVGKDDRDSGIEVDPERREMMAPERL